MRNSLHTNVVCAYVCQHSPSLPVCPYTFAFYMVAV